MYWHFVDVVWIAVFSTIYLLRRGRASMTDTASATSSSGSASSSSWASCSPSPSRSGRDADGRQAAARRPPARPELPAGRDLARSTRCGRRARVPRRGPAREPVPRDPRPAPLRVRSSLPGCGRRTTNGGRPSAARTTTEPRTEPPMTATAGPGRGPTFAGCGLPYLVAALRAAAAPRRAAWRVLLTMTPAPLADRHRQPGARLRPRRPRRQSDPPRGPARPPGDRQLLGELVRAVRRGVPAPAGGGRGPRRATGWSWSGSCGRIGRRRPATSWRATARRGRRRWIRASRCRRDYGMLGPPETYFIDRDGIVEARQIGQISQASLDEKLAAIIEE